MTPIELISHWRRLAADVDRFGESPAGRALRMCADDLERALDGGSTETLSLTEAAVRSGFHPDSLGRMIRRGVLRNVGTPARPRVLVSELPSKPGNVRATRQVARPGSGGPSSTTATAEAIARDAIAGRIRPA